MNLSANPGGYVDVHSEVGRGTTVKLYFPRADAAQDATIEPDSMESSLPRTRETILVDEDNDDYPQLQHQRRPASWVTVAAAALFTSGYSRRRPETGCWPARRGVTGRRSVSPNQAIVMAIFGGAFSVCRMTQ